MNTDQGDEENKILQPSQDDWFLAMLVKLTNGTDAEYPVTLAVGGLLISGYIASGHRYFEAFAESLKSGMTNISRESAEANVAPFRKIKQIYLQDGKDAEATAPDPAYVHLRSALFFGPSNRPIPDNGGVWWRGRLSSVDGFTLGTLGQP